MKKLVVLFVFSLSLQACQSSSSSNPDSISGLPKENMKLAEDLLLLDSKSIQEVSLQTMLGLLNEGSGNIEKRIIDLDSQLKLICNLQFQTCTIERK